jgi:hypothetical protein
MQNIDILQGDSKRSLGVLFGVLFCETESAQLGGIEGVQSIRSELGLIL